MRASRILAAALAFAAGTAVAGTADIKFIDPDHFTDLASNKWEEQDTLRALAGHIQQLAARLPADQVLRVEVFDVDLAGTPVPALSEGQRLRIMSNQADAPAISLRWSLEAGGQVLRGGQERLTDLDYANRQLATWRSYETPLYYEHRLLDQWFSRELVPQSQAYAR